MPIAAELADAARSFAPVADGRARVLILGSMPGKASLVAGRYYAHPRNAFWRIMGELVQAGPSLPYAERLAVLAGAGIALWDVLKTCVRRGSLDTAIMSAVPNDFERFFEGNPHITRVFFNGAMAEQCFKRYVLQTLRSPAFVYQRLPSTSPANAGASYAEKLAAWRAITEHADAVGLRMRDFAAPS